MHVKLHPIRLQSLDRTLLTRSLRRIPLKNLYPCVWFGCSSKSIPTFHFRRRLAASLAAMGIIFGNGQGLTLRIFIFCSQPIGYDTRYSM